MPIITGFLEKVTYQNEQTGFMVARLQEMGKKEPTTIVGNLTGIHIGESLKLTGRWVYHKKFGQQFQVDHYEITVPSTVHGIQKYLGSGLIKGIGPIMAERIVKQFGLKTLEIIEKTPEKLTKVEGIGFKRIEMITTAWAEQKGIREIMVFLQSHGVGAAHSAKIYKQYGDSSISVVRENPYRLAKEIHGIGFLTADKIAQHLGIDPNALIRIRAGLLYVLNQLAEEGHVYYPEALLIRKVQDILKVNEEVIHQALKDLTEDKEIIIENLDSEGHHRAVYLTPSYVAETRVAKKLIELKESPSTVRSIHPEKAIEWIQKELHIQLAAKQKEAILLAATSKVLIITGGPGTGKTTIITAILRIFEQLKLKSLLAAPTGRAAKRMSEATGHEAKTIHRLLEFSPQQGRFKKDQDDPLEADVLIIDEISMVDIHLMFHLLNALPSRAHLILVGDEDQLPSVGPGNVLRDLIHSGSFTVVRLTEIFRQAQESMIVVNAHRINRGEFPLLRVPEQKESSDFYFVQEEDPEKAMRQILDLCRERIPKRFGYDPVRDIQILTPMHKGVIGVTNLNLELQKILNPDAPSIPHGSRTLRLGDKVMQIVNDYEKEVFNGDIGWITAVHPENREITIEFDRRLITYDYTDLDEVVLAYAISVHKSQGSEYPVVIFPVTTQHYLLLQRNLLYTAITRAKKLVVLIGTQKALAIAINNNKTQLRFTRLFNRLAAV